MTGKKPREQELVTYFIRDGIVIDHLLPGTATVIADILKGAFGEVPINISEYIGSRKRAGEDGKPGRKGRITLPVEYSDVGECEQKLGEYTGRIADPELLTRIALISPDNTISVIKGGEVLVEDGSKHKLHARIPEEVGVVRCPNDSCISNSEKVPIRAVYTQGGEHEFRCHYCETGFDFSDLRDKKLLTYLD